MPADVTDPDVRVNGNLPRAEVMRNGYAWLEGLQPGDVVQFNWDLEERVMLFDEGALNLTGHWKGDTLMRLTPEGSLCPLYQRSKSMTPALPLSASGPVKEVDSL